MMKILLGLLMMTVTINQVAQIPFDLSQINKYGNTSILNTLCNEETQIDLFFSSDSKLTCDSLPCTTASPASSTMKFLDINGNDLQLTLTEAYSLDNQLIGVTGWPRVDPKYYFAFVF
jgi:hypothetical protein